MPPLLESDSQGGKSAAMAMNIEAEREGRKAATEALRRRNRAAW
jgi:hypothetical protein